MTAILHRDDAETIARLEELLGIAIRHAPPAAAKPTLAPAVDIIRQRRLRPGGDQRHADQRRDETPALLRRARRSPSTKRARRTVTAE